MSEWAAAVVLPVARANPRSVGMLVEGGDARSTSLVVQTGPSTLYIALRQGPTNQKELDASDQGAVKGIDRAVGLSR